jgi:hypothetical protein
MPGCGIGSGENGYSCHLSNVRVRTSERIYERERSGDEQWKWAEWRTHIQRELTTSRPAAGGGDGRGRENVARDQGIGGVRVLEWNIAQQYVDYKRERCVLRYKQWLPVTHERSGEARGRDTLR